MLSHRVGPFLFYALCLKSDDVAAGLAGEKRLDVCRPSIDRLSFLGFVCVSVVSADQLCRQVV